MAAEIVWKLGFDQSQKEVLQDGKAKVDKPNTTTPLPVNPGKDPPPTAVASNACQDKPVKSPLQPSASAPTALAMVVSSLGTLKWSDFHWSHVVFAGLVLISASGTTLVFQNKIIPRFKSWIRKTVEDVEDEDEDEEFMKITRARLEEQTAAAGKAASEAAISVANAGQTILNSNSEGMRQIVESVGLLNTNVHEIKALIIAALTATGDLVQTTHSPRPSAAEGGHYQANLAAPQSESSSRVQNYGPSSYNHLHDLQRQSESSSRMQNHGMNNQSSSLEFPSWWWQNDNFIPPERPKRPIPPQLEAILIPEAAEANRRSR